MPLITATISPVEIVYSVISALLGLVVGSFLNVCIDRLPHGESILNPPSHCQSCHHRLVMADLIPLFSYLRLHGHCRYCQSSIPRRIFWVELATGIIFALLYQHYGLSAELGIMVLYTGMFIIIFVIDLEHGLILNKIVYPGMMFALLVAIFLSPLWLGDWPSSGIVNAGIGGGIGFAIFLLLTIISRGGMGWGDVKLAAFIGFTIGFPLVLVALIMGAILGGVVAVILLVTKKRGRRETIPFGPFLSLAAMITLLWGNNILHWYIGLL